MNIKIFITTIITITIFTLMINLTTQNETNNTNENKPNDIDYEAELKKLGDVDLSTFPKHNYEDSILTPKTEEEKKQLEEDYSQIKDEVLQKLFREIKLYEKAEVDKETFRVLVYRMLADEQDVSSEEKFYYLQIVNEISKKVPEKMPTGSIQGYLSGKIFDESVETIMYKNFGDEGVQEYRNSEHMDLEKENSKNLDL